MATDYKSLLQWVCSDREIEFKNSVGKWQLGSPSLIRNLITAANFGPEMFRLKPETVTL